MAPHSKCWLENCGDTTDPMWVWLASDTPDGLCHHDAITQAKTGYATQAATSQLQLAPATQATVSATSRSATVWAKIAHAFA